jgi:hypothetical protein
MMVATPEYKPWTDCAVCGAPTEIDKEYTMVAYTVAGEQVVPFVRVRCAAGHQYDEEVRGA